MAESRDNASIMFRKGSRPEKPDHSLSSSAETRTSSEAIATNSTSSPSYILSQRPSSPPPSGDHTSLPSKPSFHKINTIDNLFAVFYGFQSGQLLVQGENRIYCVYCVFLLE